MTHPPPRGRSTRSAGRILRHVSCFRTDRLPTDLLATLDHYALDLCGWKSNRDKQNFVRHSIRKSSRIFTISDHDLCGFATVFDSTFHTALDGDLRSICRSDEWYVDLICARKGCGSALLWHIEQLARSSGKSQLRAYVLPDACSFFERRGFRRKENCADASEQQSDCFYYTERHLSTKGVRMTHSLDESEAVDENEALADSPADARAAFRLPSRRRLV